MKTNENNTILSGDRRVPGDVYMMLSPEGQVREISTEDFLYKCFGDFLNDYAYYTLREMKPPYINCFFVHYRFHDSGQIPDQEVGESNEAFGEYLLSIIKKLGLKPVNTCRFYPFLYCYQKSLDPLLPENSEQALKKTADYQRAALYYSDFGVFGGTKVYKGIETDRGVVLFDNTERGTALQRRYKDFFTANFFDPRLGVTFLRTLELIPSEEQRAKVNPDLEALYCGDPEPFGVLPADCYTDMKEIGIYTGCEHYDMSATLANFAALAGFDEGENPFIPEHTYNIGCLLYLSSPECRDPTIQDDFPNIFSYHDWFDALAERFAKATTDTEKTQALAAIRERAGHLLRQDYPNIRLPQQARLTLEEQNKATHQGRQLPDVRAKSIKFSGKKKGRGIR